MKRPLRRRNRLLRRRCRLRCVLLAFLVRHPLRRLRDPQSRVLLRLRRDRQLPLRRRALRRVAEFPEPRRLVPQ